MEFVPCNRETCPATEVLASMSSVALGIGRNMDRAAGVYHDSFEEARAAYETARDAFGLDSIEYQSAHGKVRDAAALAGTAQQMAEAWKLSQQEAATAVNGIACRVAEAGVCPRAVRAQDSLVSRHWQR